MLKGQALPALTQFVLGVGNLAKDHALLGLGGAVAVYLGAGFLPAPPPACARWTVCVCRCRCLAT
jgi:type II secretory pathway component PulF